MEIPLCMHMNPTTQLSVLRDILYVLDTNEIRRFVIINGHGGNAFQPLIRELSLEFPDIIMSYVNWWTVAKADKYFVEPGDHAGELETSAMMYTNPNLVAPLDEAGTGAETKFKIEGLREKWAWTPRRWIYISEDTGVGNPKKATKEKGELFVKQCTEKIAKFILEFSHIQNEEDLYE